MLGVYCGLCVACVIIILAPALAGAVYAAVLAGHGEPEEASPEDPPKDASAPEKADLVTHLLMVWAASLGISIPVLLLLIRRIRKLSRSTYPRPGGPTPT